MIDLAHSVKKKLFTDNTCPFAEICFLFFPYENTFTSESFFKANRLISNQRVADVCDNIIPNGVQYQDQSLRQKETAASGNPLQNQFRPCVQVS